jgi:lipopolysaccharide export system permease protein
MKINSIINRYMLLEMVPPFILNVGFFLFVFLMMGILDITNYIVNYQVSIFAFLLMLLYTMPFSLQFIIPMSVMISILLTLLRMSSDNEVIALKAGGFSIYTILPPVLIFCFIGCSLTAYMTFFGIPWGWTSRKALIGNIMSSSFEIGIKERTFNNIEGVMLYVNKVDLRNKQLIDIFIEDKRNENLVSTVVAPRGRILSEPERLFFRLRLFNGLINQVNIKNENVNTIRFDTYEFSLDINKAMQRSKKDSKHRLEMSFDEIRHYLKTNRQKDILYFRTLMDYYKKFSIPVACFALGLLAVPLGYQSTITRRSYGLVLGLTFFIIYYVLLTAGWGFGESGVYPPVVGMWLPNVLIGGLGVFLIYRTGEEYPLLIDYGLRLGEWILSRLSKDGPKRRA